MHALAGFAFAMVVGAIVDTVVTYLEFDRRLSGMHADGVQMRNDLACFAIKPFHDAGLRAVEMIVAKLSPMRAVVLQGNASVEPMKKLIELDACERTASEVLHFVGLLQQQRDLLKVNVPAPPLLFRSVPWAMPEVVLIIS